MRQFFQRADHFCAFFWQRILRATPLTEEDAAILRIVTGIYLLCLRTPFYGWIADMPPTFFFPPLLSVGALFPGQMPAWLLHLADLVNPLLILGITIGVKARWCGLLCVVLNLWLSSFGYSFGKIGHPILIWVLLGFLSFTNWGTLRALIPDRPIRLCQPETPIGLLAIALAFAFFSAGFEKALVWIDFDLSTSGFYSWFLNGYFSQDRDALLAPYCFQLPPLVFELADTTVPLLEVSGLLFLLAGPRTWRVWLAALCAFHVGNVLLLNIPFLSNPPVYLAFIISPFLSFLSARSWLPRVSAARWKIFAAVPVLFAGIHFIQRSVGRSSEVLFVSEADDATSLTVYLALGVWMIMTAVSACALLAPVNRPGTVR